MDYKVTPEDLQAIYDWMDGRTPQTPVSEASARFFRLADALRNSLLQDRTRAVQEVGRLNKRLDRITEREDNAQTDIAFGEDAYDSDTLLRAIMLSAHIQNIRISNTRGIHILYLLYASRLLNNRSRLTVEHPVANVRGPQFWTAAKALEGTFDFKAAKQARQSICEREPGLAVHIDNAVRKFGKYPCTEHNDPVTRLLMESKPYKDARPSRDYQKWNRELNDSEIYRWRKNAQGLSTL